MKPAVSTSIPKQPYFTRKQVDRICQAALEKVGLMPDAPAPVRIDAFVEKYFKIHPTYEALPNGVLGFTEFAAGGVSAMVISSAFDDEGTKIAERRLRTTFAHEAGHGLLHAELFSLGDKPHHLFDDDNPKPQILCREEHSSAARGYHGKWWETQANLAIGGLLMPVPLTLEAAKPFTEERGLLGLPVLAERDRAVAALAEIFEVNPVVARIRLDGLFGETDGAQPSL
jgi:hypothetical protein